MTYVFSKGGSDTTLSLSLGLTDDEIVTSVTLGDVTPLTLGSELIVAWIAGPGPEILLAVQGGSKGFSYGFDIQVQTSVRLIDTSVAVVVKDESFAPYRAQDPESYADLMGSLDAGKSAVATAIFTLPLDLDSSGAYVLWELLDPTGVVYSSGNAYEVQVSDNGVQNVVTAKSVINVPLDTPHTIDRPYQLRYALKVPNAGAGYQSTFYSYENLIVTGLAEVPLGCSSSVELQGDPAFVSIVLDRMYDQVTVEVYQDNKMIASAPINEAERVASGYYYAGSFETSALPVSLVPYQIVWKYSLSGGPIYRDSCSLWVVNSSILSCIEDCKAKINKARTTLYGTHDSMYKVDTLMTWLRRAADAFNGAYGVFTSFTFLNAKGSIREYWLLYAELFAIESQYLLEGEKAFNFQGSNISLDVDKTQYLDSAASKIQSRLDNEFKPFKQNLVIRGATSGDGSVDPTILQKGAIGAVGISISQVSLWSRFRPIIPRRF